MTISTGNRRSGTPSRPALQLLDLVPVRLTPIGRRSLRALAAHGADLCAVARMITQDEELGARLVAHAIAACCRNSPDPGLGDLSAVVVAQWISGSIHGSPERACSEVPTAVLLDVHRLPHHHRALLALCKFGGHTYREAADVLDIPAETAASHLSEALRTLGTPRP